MKNPIRRVSSRTFGAALLLAAALGGCREKESIGWRNEEKPLRRDGLRQDAVGCFKVSFAGAGHGDPPRAYFLRLDSTHAGWIGLPGYRIARPAASDGREVATKPVWSADSLTDSVRVLASDGYAYTNFIFDLLAARDTFAGIEGYGGDTGDEKIRRTVVSRINCDDYTWSRMTYRLKH